MSSNKPPKDREAEQQRWAARQEATADLLRETLDAAGARAAEISEWLDSSFMTDEPEVNGKEPPPPTPERPARETGKGSPSAQRDEPAPREAWRPHEKKEDRAKS